MRKRRWIGFLLAAVLAGAGATAALGLDVQLKYVKFPEFNRENPNAGQAAFYPRSMSFRGGSPDEYKKPAGDWKLPNLISQYPIYYQASIAGEKRLMVFDQKDAKDNYTRLYFDANGNRDLTDDPPIDGEYEKKGGWAYQGVDFPIVEATLKQDGREAKYAFQPVLQQIDFWKKTHANVMIGIGGACWHEGEGELNGKRFRFAIQDGDSNGRFSDFASIPKPDPNDANVIYPSGDRLFVLPEGKGNYSNSAPLCNRLSMGNKVYEVAVDQAADKLILTETKDKLPAIRIPDGIRQVLLASGDLTLTALDPAGTINAPAGRFRLISYAGVIKDPQGKKWEIEATATGKTPAMAADASGENPLQIGPPFKARAAVPLWQMENIKQSKQINGGQVQLEFAVYDAADRQLNALSCNDANVNFEKSKTNPGWPKEPNFRILDAAGKPVATGDFEYG